MNSKIYTDQAKIMALTRFSGVNPRLFDRLFALLGTVDAIFDVDPDWITEKLGVEQDTADMIAEAGKFLDPAVTVLDRLTARQIRTVSLFDPDYPILLNELNDPPTLLFVRGDLPRSDLKTVALSGTSGAAFEGMEMTTRLAREFSKAGVQIISGMTSGIAASAHLAARGAGGRSFAVLDSGFDRSGQLRRGDQRVSSGNRCNRYQFQAVKPVDGRSGAGGGDNRNVSRFGKDARPAKGLRRDW